MQRGATFIFAETTVNIETESSLRKDAFLFGEAQSRVIVSVNKNNSKSLEELLNSKGQAFSRIGHVTENNIVVDNENWGSITEFKEIYNTTIESHLD